MNLYRSKVASEKGTTQKVPQLLVQGYLANGPSSKKGMWAPGQAPGRAAPAQHPLVQGTCYNADKETGPLLPSGHSRGGVCKPSLLTVPQGVLSCSFPHISHTRFTSALINCPGGGGWWVYPEREECCPPELPAQAAATLDLNRSEHAGK